MSGAWRWRWVALGKVKIGNLGSPNPKWPWFVSLLWAEWWNNPQIHSISCPWCSFKWKLGNTEVPRKILETFGEKLNFTGKYLHFLHENQGCSSARKRRFWVLPRAVSPCPALPGWEMEKSEFFWAVNFILCLKRLLTGTRRSSASSTILF